MAIKYLAGERLIGTAAERAALSGSNLTAVPQTSWKILGRTILTSEADTIDVSTFTAKDNLLILAHLEDTNGTIHANLQFNSDTGSNYTARVQTNGTTDWTNINQTGMRFGAGTSNTRQFIVSRIRNIATQEKLVNTHMAYTQDSTLYHEETAGKWTNTSNQITSVQVPNGQSGTFEVGSEVVVFGCDDDEADSGTNAWQELTNKVTTATGSDFTTDAFTAKKYLKFELYADTESADMSPDLEFNGNTSGYATKHQQNGGGSGAAFTDRWAVGYSANNHAHIYATGMIINVSDKWKFGIYDVFSDLEAGNNAIKRWEYTGLWTNTSAQITTMKFGEGTSNTFGAGSYIRVWGTD